MVARFLRLRLDAQAAAFRRGVGSAVGAVLVVLCSLALTVAVCAALVAARGADDPDRVGDVVTLVGATAALLFITVPLLAAHDGTTDPRSYAILGVDARHVARGIGAASFVSLPAVALAVCALFTVATWSTHPWAAVLAFLAAVVATATWVGGARLATSLAAHFLVGGRSRSSTGVIVVVLMAVVLVAVGVSIATDGTGTGAAGVLAGIAAWTPFGVAWAVGGTAASGLWGLALLQLLYAVVVAAAVAVGWRAWVGHVMAAPARRVSGDDRVGLGWFSWMPARPAGAIAARSLTYWGHDSRYWVQLALIPVFPFIMVGALLAAHIADPRALALIPLPVVCLFLGWVAHDDVAYDGTAIWLHVVSGTRGLSDRVGRLVPVALIAVPVLVVGTALTVLAYGDVDVLPAVAGVAFCFVAVGMGLSSVFSALVPYPAPRPGDGAFAHPQTTGASAAVSQSVTMLLTLVLAAAPVAMMVLGVVDGPAWFPLGLWTGLGIGVVVLVCGVWLGAVAFDRRGPELMSFALRNA